jgi:myosin-1
MVREQIWLVAIYLINTLLGWWLANRLNSDDSGWVPSAYIEEIAAPAPPPPPPPPVSRAAPTAINGINGGGTRGKPNPPAPPSKRPAGKKPVPPPAGGAARDSGYSGSGASSATRDSGGSVAGSLAEALRARQAAMNSQKKPDDDW